MNEKTNEIELKNGDKLVFMDKEEKKKLEIELLQLCEKYNAAIVPVLERKELLSEVKTQASMHIYKLIKKEENAGEEEKEAKA